MTSERESTRGSADNCLGRLAAWLHARARLQACGVFQCSWRHACSRIRPARSRRSISSNWPSRLEQGKVEFEVKLETLVQEITVKAEIVSRPDSRLWKALFDRDTFVRPHAKDAVSQVFGSYPAAPLHDRLKAGYQDVCANSPLDRAPQQVFKEAFAELHNLFEPSSPRGLHDHAADVGGRRARPPCRRIVQVGPAGRGSGRRRRAGRFCRARVDGGAVARQEARTRRHRAGPRRLGEPSRPIQGVPPAAEGKIGGRSGARGRPIRGSTSINRSRRWENIPISFACWACSSSWRSMSPVRLRRAC